MRFRLTSPHLLVDINRLDGLAYIHEADGSQVTTVEGLAQNGQLHPIQAAFIEEHGLQCGFCTPGMMLTSLALLQENPNPTEDQVRWGISGNLCRCTGYVNIIKAMRSAAGKMQAAAE